MFVEYWRRFSRIHEIENVMLEEKLECGEDTNECKKRGV